MAEWLAYVLADDDDGHPTVVDVDVDFNDASLRTAFPHAIQMAVKCESGSDGLPTEAADDALYALEQKIEALLGADGALVASVAENGTYAFLAYAKSEAPAAALESAATAAGFTIAGTKSESDPQWNEYEEWTLEGEDLEEARDCSQLEQMEEAGEDLTARRLFGFDFEFPTRDRADEAADALLESGFAVDDEGEDETGEVVQARILLAPESDAIGNARRRATGVAEKFGGVYLGWGSEAVEA